MAIRRREKALTPAEALALAKKNATPYWFGLEPLLAASKEPARAFALDGRFAERPWLVFFADPLALSTRPLLHFMKDLARRYEPQKLGIVVILASPLAPPFVKDTGWVRERAVPLCAPLPVAMDPEGMLAAAFGVLQAPELLLFQNGQPVLRRAGAACALGAELELQRVFRLVDPGLALFPVMELGGGIPADLPGLALERDVLFSGQWRREGGAWTTSDPLATFSFESPAPRLGIVAAGVAGAVEIAVELPADLPAEPIHDADLVIDAQALRNPTADPARRRRGVVHVSEPRLYALFHALPPTHRRLLLRFPSVGQVGVAIHGVRVAR